MSEEVAFESSAFFLFFLSKSKPTLTNPSISPFTVGHSFKLLTSGEFLCVYNQEEIFLVVFKLSRFLETIEKT